MVIVILMSINSVFQIVTVGKNQTNRADDKAFKWQYVENVKTLVSVQRNGMEYLGYLDAAGNFTPDMSKRPFRVGSWTRSVPSYKLVNYPNTRPVECVYEFRAGMLIRGLLMECGNFVPEEDSKIVAFKDYQFNKDAIRIYNLPGRFVKVDD
jgi:hypothetical protein